ncbi:hypothetical protein [Streptomyces sp. NBC_01497]|nr:hypothetical protein [Streptomyces sp. NBC_01497]
MSAHVAFRHLGAVAEFAPWRWWCGIEWAASPMGTTESVCQVSTGSMS